MIIKKDLTDGAESSIFNTVDKNTVSSPIEQRRHSGKGVPWAIEKRDFPLNHRQQTLLDKLTEFDSTAMVGKDDVAMTDLSALTAKTGNEFAMFTRKRERLVIRGDRRHVNVDPSRAAELKELGYKWSGHTHVKIGDLLPSDGDREVLAAFEQDSGVIYDAEGKHRRFFR